MRDELKSAGGLSDTEFLKLLKKLFQNYRERLPVNYYMDVAMNYKPIEDHPKYINGNQFVFEVTVQKKFRDNLNQLAISSGILLQMIDCMTSTLVLKCDPKMRPHVSISISMDNLGLETIKEGQKLIFVCKKAREYRDNILTSATVYNEDCSEIYAEAYHVQQYIEHTKPKL